MTIDTIHHIITSVIVAIATFLGICSVASCQRGIYSEACGISSDTVLIVNFQHDSIYVHDSIFTETKTQGDTIFVNRISYRDRYKEVLRHDTCYVNRTDTIIKPMPTVVPHRQASFKEGLVNSAISLGALALVWGAITIKNKYHG